MKRPGVRFGGYAGEVAAALRRRKEVRRPRVRIRLDHGQARLLDDTAPETERLLTLARELIGEPPTGAPAKEDEHAR